MSIRNYFSSFLNLFFVIVLFCYKTHSESVILYPQSNYLYHPSRPTNGAACIKLGDSASSIFINCQSYSLSALSIRPQDTLTYGVLYFGAITTPIRNLVQAGVFRIDVPFGPNSSYSYIQNNTQNAVRYKSDDYWLVVTFDIRNFIKEKIDNRVNVLNLAIKTTQLVGGFNNYYTNFTSCNSDRYNCRIEINYFTREWLKFSSNLGNVPIRLYINNVEIGAYNAYNKLERTGSTVKLVSPTTYGGKSFKHWLRNGVFYSSSPTVTFALEENVDFQAVFEESCTIQIEGIRSNEIYYAKQKLRISWTASGVTPNVEFRLRIGNEIIAPQQQSLEFLVPDLGPGLHNNFPVSVFTVNQNPNCTNTVYIQIFSSYRIPSVNPGANPRTIYIRDPVDVISGNYYLEQQDFSVPGKLGFILKRSYNSIGANRSSSLFGYGWSSILDCRVDTMKGNLLEVKLEDGRIHSFYDSAGTIKPQRFAEGLLYWDPQNSKNLIYISPKNHKYNFSLEQGGKLNFFEDNAGNRLVLIYQHGKLTKLIDPAQREYQVLLNNLGLVSQIVDFTGRTWRYFYDKDSTLRSVYSPCGDSVVYLFDNKKRLIKFFDWNGNLFVQNFYSDEEGPSFDKIIKQINPLGASTHFIYDTAQKITRVIVNKGRDTVIFQHDGERVQKQILPTGLTESYSFDSQGNLNFIKDFNGGEWRYSYNDQGNVFLEVSPSNDSLIFSYNPSGNTLIAKDKIGVVESYEYFPNGLLKTFFDGENRSIFEYDSCGYPILEKIITESDTLKIRRTFDRYGNLKELIDPDGNKINCTFDSLNRITDLKFIHGFDTLKAVINYDKMGNITYFQNGNGSYVKLKYDAGNNLIERVEPLGKKTLFVYDSSTNLLKKIIDPKGTPITFEYPRILNKPSKIYFTHGLTEERTYDRNGNLVEKKVSGKAPYKYGYDSSNRLILEILPTGDTIKYFYDSRNRLTRKVLSSGPFYEYYWDTLNNLRKVVNLNGDTVLYETDKFKRLIKKVLPSGAFESWKFNSNNQVVEFTNFHGEKTQYFYGPFSRLDSIEIPTGNRIKFTYDKALKLTMLEDVDKNSLKFARDSLSRIISIEKSNGTKDSIVWDPSDNIIQTIDANGRKMDFSYDSLNRIVNVLDGNRNTWKFSYLSNDLVTKVFTPSGRTFSFIFDSSGRIISNSLYGRSYKYGPNNTLSKIFYQTSERTLLYDKAFRLQYDIVSKDNQADTIFYEYNPDGLITKKRNKNGELALIYNSMHFVTSLISNKDTILFSYEGPKKIQTSISGLKINYGFDPKNRLEQIKVFDKVLKFTYTNTGLVSEVKYPPNISCRYYYTYGNLIDSILYCFGEKPLVKEEYFYDKVGNCTTQVKFRQLKTIFVDSLVDKKNSWNITLNELYYPKPTSFLIISPNFGFDSYPILSSLSFEYKAPILFVHPLSLLLNDNLLSHFQKLISPDSFTIAFILGNQLHISEKIESELKSMGVDSVIRVVSTDRFEFSRNFTELLKYSSDTIFIVPAETPYELGLVSPYSVKNKYPIFLSYADSIPETTKKLIGGSSKKIILVGSKFTPRMKNELLSLGHKIIEFTKTSPTQNSIELAKYLIKDHCPIMFVSEFSRFRENLILAPIIANRNGALLAIDSFELLPQILQSLREFIDTLVILKTNTLSQQILKRIHFSASGVWVDTVFYQYDAMNQLIRENHSMFGTKEYAYDADFNRISLTVNDKLFPLTYDAKGLLLSSKGQKIFKYDSAGNPIEIIQDSITYKFERDLRGRITKVSSKLGTHLFNYDPLGRLTLHIYGQDTTRLVYGDDFDPILEINGTDTTFFISGFATDDILWKIKNGKFFVPVKDLNGSFLGFITEDGKLIARTEYDAFGTTLLDENMKFSRFGYIGREKLGFADLYFCRARTLDVSTGRFLEIEPLENIQFTFPQTMNLFTYAFNNPLKYKDLFGTNPHDFLNYIVLFSKTAITKPLEFRDTVLHYLQINRENVHFALDILGLTSAVTPLILTPASPLAILGLALGTTADIINASLYVQENDFFQATLSLVALLPDVGDLATIIRIYPKVIRKYHFLKNKLNFSSKILDNRYKEVREYKQAVEKVFGPLSSTLGIPPAEFKDFADFLGRVITFLVSEFEKFNETNPTKQMKPNATNSTGSCN